MPNPTKSPEIAPSLAFWAAEMTATNGASLMGCLNEMYDPRKPTHGTLHDLREILVIAIAATLSDSDTVEDIVSWARKKEAWLRRFLELKNGIPSEETFRAHHPCARSQAI